MQLYKYFLLTVTLLVAMAIPGCKNETSVADLFPQTTSTTSTTPVAALSQKEFNEVLAAMQNITDNASYITAESYFITAAKIEFITDNFNMVKSSANLTRFVSFRPRSGPGFFGYTASYPLFTNEKYNAYPLTAFQNLSSPLVQVRVSSEAASTCSGFSNFDEIAHFLKYNASTDVYKSINISEAMQCVPTCLGSSFTMNFMSDFASLVNVCANKKTNFTELVQNLDAVLTSLNGSIYDKFDDASSEVADWSDVYKSYSSSVHDLASNAPVADEELATPAIRDIIEHSCIYSDMIGQMEATCTGFATALNLMSEIQKLARTQSNWQWGSLSMFEVVDWDMNANYMGTFCNNDSYYYQSNAIWSCNETGWLDGNNPDYGGCDDYGILSCDPENGYLGLDTLYGNSN